MPQEYRSIPFEEQSQASHDDASVDEKLAWRGEKAKLSVRIRKATMSHWAWMAQAVILSASITFFALGLCMRSTKQAESIPMAFCR
jgi:hypothetical protein